MTQDTTPASGAADLPKALRLAAAISNLLCSNEAAARTLAAAADELVRLHAESEMRRAALLDEMQKAALAAGQATAAQQGAAYAALPEYGINTASHAHFRVLGFTANQMHAFADATHALRASHGQAPAQHTRPCVVCGSDEPFTGTCGSRDPRALCKQPTTTAQAADSVTAPAPPPECETEAEKRAFAFGWFKAQEAERMKAESVQEDAARYRFLRDGEWRDTDLEPFIRLQLNTLWDAKIDAARKQGASHDR